MKVDVGWGQACPELIINPDLTINVGATNGSNAFQFPNSLINGWRCSHGTPHFFGVESNGNCVLNSTDPTLDKFTEEVTCVTTNRFSYLEGFYQVLRKPVIKDQYLTYTLRVRASLLNCTPLDNDPGTLSIRLTNHLDPLLGCGTLPTNLGNSQGIINANLTTHTPFDFVEQLNYSTLNQNSYTQIWILGLTGQENNLAVYDVNMSCYSTALTGVQILSQVGNTITYGPVEVRPFVTYHWVVKKDGVENGMESFDKFPVFTFAEPGTYSVSLYAVDENDCCALVHGGVVVIECENPESNFAVNNDCPDFNMQVLNPQSGTTYTWSTPNGNPASGTGTSFTTTYLNNGSYTITLTATNECGSSSSTQTVMMNCEASCDNLVDCISIGTNMNSITFLSSLILGQNPIIPNTPVLSGINIENLCLNVKGTLIVDVLQVNFINTRWFMEPGSSIRVRPAGIWGPSSFVNSRLQGCTQMWRGIVVEANTNFPSGIILSNTTIQDAWRGVELENNTLISAQNSKFYNNYIGIYTTADINRKNIVVSDLKNNVFEDLRNMLPPYPNQPDYSSRFHTGISINGCLRFNVGIDETTKNTFRNLITGIHSFNTSNLFCYGNEFEDSYFTTSVRTRGVLIVGSGTNSLINKKNKFLNLNSGVEVVSSNGGVIIDGNTFVNNRPNASTFIEGIKSFSNQMIRLSISYNNFNFSSGRCIAHDGSATSVFINHNKPHISGPAYFIFQTNTSVTSRILHNTTTFENGINYPGIVHYFSDCDRVNAFSNKILQPPTFIASRPTSGFLIDACTKSLFRNNLIEIPSRAFNVSGFENSQDIAYCCNQANNTVVSAGIFEASFYMELTKGQSFVRQNDLRILRLLGEIREQKNAGNNWTTGSLAVLDNPTPSRIDQNTFLVDDTHTAANPRPDNVEPAIIEQQWFNGIGTEHPTCATTPNCNLPEFYFTPDDVTVSSFWPFPDPIDSVIIIVDPARPHCSVVLDLYQRLLQVDSMADPLEYWYLVTTLEKWRSWQGESWFNSCLGTIYEYNPDVDLWNDSEKEKDGIRDFDNGIRSNANELIEDIALLNDELNTYALDSLMQLDSIAFVRYQELTELQEEFDSLMESVNLEVINRVNTLIPIIQSLPAPLPFLADKKAAWIAELKIMSGGVTALDSSEWNVIRNIARKCPEFYGQSVFIAKNLMLLVGEQIETDTSCSIVKIRSEANKGSDSKLLVSPNPGSGTFNFQVSEDTFISEISIFNVSGVKVHDTKISDRSGQIIIDISRFVPGIYFYEVKTGDNKIEKGKLIKI